MRRLLVATGALVLAGCPAPRFVSGVVFGRAADDKGVHALVSPIEGASVTWSCPAGVNGPPPQTLKTDYEGRFKSKEYHFDMPEACALVVEKDGFTPTRIPFAKLHDPSRSDSSRVVRAAVELRRVAPEPEDRTQAVGELHCLDLPKAAGPGGLEAPMLAVDITTGGFRLNGKATPSNDFVREVREAKTKEPDLRAIIRGDRHVSYADVVHAIDLVKQGGVGKLALGISAGLDEPFDSIGVDGCATARTKMRVTVLADGSTLADGTKTDDLLPKLRAARENDRGVCVVVSGDKDTSHGAIVRTLDLARTAKIGRIAFANGP